MSTTTKPVNNQNQSTDPASKTGRCSLSLGRATALFLSIAVPTVIVLALFLGYKVPHFPHAITALPENIKASIVITAVIGGGISFLYNFLREEQRHHWVETGRDPKTGQR